MVLVDRSGNLPHAIHSYKANQCKATDKKHISFRLEDMQSSKRLIARPVTCNPSI